MFNRCPIAIGQAFALERKEAPAYGTMLNAAARLEVKAAGAEGAEPMSFTGYAAVFGNVDYWGDMIVPGAFRDTLAAIKSSGIWPAMLLQHGGATAEDQTPIGIWAELEAAQIGLKASGVLADTARGREIHALLKMKPRPAITGLSIGFRAKDFSVRTRPEEPRRTLKTIDLVEISLVTNPANPKARVDGTKAFADPGLDELAAILGRNIATLKA